MVVSLSNVAHRFLRELKDQCLSSTGPGNRPFWEAVKDLGASITLIGKAEAAQSVSWFPDLNTVRLSDELSLGNKCQVCC